MVNISKKLYPFGHPVCQMLRMGVLRQAPHGKVYPFGHPVCQMLRMDALRQAPRDKVRIDICRPFTE